MVPAQFFLFIIKFPNGYFWDNGNFFCKSGILQTKITFINKETNTKMNSVTVWIGRDVGGEWIYEYVGLSPFAFT